jgi:hypothetical protein
MVKRVFKNNRFQRYIRAVKAIMACIRNIYAKIIIIPI